MQRGDIVTTIEVTQKASRGDRPTEPLIFEKHVEHATGVDFPPLDVPETESSNEITGQGIDLPAVGQHDVMGH